MGAGFTKEIKAFEAMAPCKILLWRSTVLFLIRGGGRQDHQTGGWCWPWERDQSCPVQLLGWSPKGDSSPSRWVLPSTIAILFFAILVERKPNREPVASKSIGAGPAVVTSCFRTRVRVWHSAAISPGVLSLEMSSLALWINGYFNDQNRQLELFLELHLKRANNFKMPR